MTISNNINLNMINNSNKTENLSNEDGLKKVEKELRETTAQFEGMFLSLMMKTMRQASETLESGLVNKSKAEDIFTTMLDNEYVDIISKSSNTGLGNTLYEHIVNSSEEYRALRSDSSNLTSNAELGSDALKSLNKLKELDSNKAEDALIDFKFATKNL